MNGRLLRRAAEALFPFARVALLGELDVNERMFRRWMAGDAPIPAGVVEEMRALVAARHQELSDILREMGQC